MGVLKHFDAASVRRQKVFVATQKFNVVREGLSYAGICENPSCIATRRYVVVNRGFGEFIVNDDLMRGMCICSECSTPFIMTQLVLYRCRATARFLCDEEKNTEYAALDDDEFVLIGQAPGTNTSCADLALDSLLVLSVRRAYKDASCAVA